MMKFGKLEMMVLGNQLAFLTVITLLTLEKDTSETSEQIQNTGPYICPQLAVFTK
jgi:hypothetical protein